MAQTIRMLAILATGAKVSLKSIPFRWVKPLATNLPFHLTTSPLGPNFLSYTHLQAMGFLPCFLGTTCQVPSLMSFVISSCMAISHWADSGHALASARLLGVQYLAWAAVIGGEGTAIKARFFPFPLEDLGDLSLCLSLSLSSFSLSSFSLSSFLLVSRVL